MLQLKNLFIVFVFVLWILPLGVFIKPTDEKELCGGKRAICLCKKVVKIDIDAGKKIVLVHPNGFEKETPPSGASGMNFLTASSKDIHSLIGSRFLNYSTNLYSLIICKSIEHVPKS